MKKIIIKLTEEEILKNLFERKIILQKPKIVSNKKKYKRKKFNMHQDNYE